MKRALLLFLTATLMGCAHSGTQVQIGDGADFASYHSIGVPPFVDSKGKGTLIAQDINGSLQKLMYDPVDMIALQKILAQYKPSRTTGFDLEALEMIRKQTSADAVVLGRMAPDWSAVIITMFETQMGDPVLRAIIKPQGKQGTLFKTPEEVAAATLKVILGAQK